MAQAVVSSRSAGGLPAPFVDERRTRPVLWWAAIGAGFCALAAYLWGAWILGDHFQRVGTGPTEVPAYMYWNARIWESIGVVAFIGFVYFAVIRPWRREGHATWDGLFFLACIVPYWQDSGVNWTGLFFTWNATLTNFGSWNCYIPGWLPQNGCGQLEAPLFAGAWFSYGLFGYSVLMCAVLRRAKRRWPRLTRLSLVGIVLAVSVILDFVMEIVYLRAGLWQYGGSPRGWLTIFDGKHYQLPLVEPVFWGLAWTGAVCYRYFRNDRGEGIFERGIEDVGVGRTGRAWLRFFAMTAALNLCVLAYNLAYVPFALRSSWPEDVQKRSYFTQGLCGPGTEYACPDSSLPVFKPGSVSITPDGTISVPAGKRLPAPIQPAE